MKSSAALDRLPFLVGAPPATIAAVKRVLRPMSVTAGTILFRTGDEGDSCYFVEDGALEVTTGAGDILASVGPGSFVGELALLLGEPRSATVTATRDSKLSALTRHDLNKLMRSHPAISVGLSRELGRRIVSTNQRFAADRAAHRSIVWPARMVAPLVDGIRGYQRRVAVGALAGATLSGLPDRVPRVKSPAYGSDDAGLASVLLAVGDKPTQRAAAVVGAAEHVLCFEAPPPWLADAAPSNRLIRLEDSPMGLRRGVRWATDRAVGLALSSGGSKAVAHMGVILVLQEAGVEIDAVAGSSGGAVAAAALAFGLDQAFGDRIIADLARATQFRRLDINVPPRSGLSKGRRLRELVARWGLGPNLEDSPIPIWLMGSDVATGGAVAMDRGPVADALRASLSVPGAFDPWLVGEQLMIDGAVANPLPTDVLRSAGAGIVIASNVAGQSTTISLNGRLPSLGQVVGRVLNTMERERIRTLLPLADVVIRPCLIAGSTFDFSNADSAVEAGKAAARERLADVRSLLAAASGRDTSGVR